MLDVRELGVVLRYEEQEARPLGTSRAACAQRLDVPSVAVRVGHQTAQSEELSHHRAAVAGGGVGSGVGVGVGGRRRQSERARRSGGEEARRVGGDDRKAVAGAPLRAPAAPAADRRPAAGVLAVAVGAAVEGVTRNALREKRGVLRPE